MNTDPEVRTSGTRLAWVYDWLTDENIVIDAGVTVELEQDDAQGMTSPSCGLLGRILVQVPPFRSALKLIQAH